MTYEEAIKELTEMKSFAEERGSYYGEKAIPTYTLAIEALEKQIAKEPVHGHWDEERFAFCNVCSNCGLVIDRTSIKMHSGKFNYCPNCSAKMDGCSNEET